MEEGRHIGSLASFPTPGSLRIRYSHCIIRARNWCWLSPHTQSKVWIGPNIITTSIDGSKGGARDAPPGPNSFIFMQFSAKKMKNNSTFGSWRTPLGKTWIRHWNLLHLWMTIYNIFTETTIQSLLIRNPNSFKFFHKYSTQQYWRYRISGVITKI